MFSFFFFSSRRRHTRCSRDWSSDVCSSDLSVQFFNQAGRDIPDLPDRIARGDLLSLKAWLNERIHRWGRRYEADELVRRLTGEPLTPDHFLTYLENKYGELYKL